MNNNALPGWSGGAGNADIGDWDVFDVYAESETKFFFTLTIIPVELSFTRNAQGEVMTVTPHVAWLPDSVGKKLRSLSAAKAAAPPAAF